ncbi:MAG: RNA methyltransferase [Candidatus Omnitrophica bacterium]|nr:RNA methyltransferase [Candidatus Omnitrophota bacterium]
MLERLEQAPETIHKVLLQDNLNLPELQKLVNDNNVTLERLSAKQLTRVKSGRDLQGVVAKVEQFKYTSFDALLDRSGTEQLTLLFLDRINDPQNLGVIIRTAACFGKFAVIIPKFSACQVTEAVLHVACGGENYVPVALVANLSPAITAAKKCGYWIAGGEISDDAEDINKVRLTFPLGFVLGSEGEGIRYGLSKLLDKSLRIPMPGAQLSFNVAMACAIFCHEISRQRGITK